MTATVHLHPAIVLMPDGQRSRIITLMELHMDRTFVVWRGRCTFVCNSQIKAIREAHRGKY